MMHNKTKMKAGGGMMKKAYQALLAMAKARWLAAV
jgi:hypothetical protein